MSIHHWGWDADRAGEWAAPGSAVGSPGRVVARDRDRWVIQTDDGSRVARLAPATEPGPPPVVGDWVAAAPGPSPSDPWTVVRVLPRRSRLVRGAAGTEHGDQVLAANVDRVWIVHGLDLPLNERRLERTLAVAWESGAVPEVVLTKSDLCPDPGAAVAKAEGVAPGVTVHLVGTGDAPAVERLRRTLQPGTTVVLLGPSGVGKSTLVNALDASAEAAVGAVRDGDRKGRHTTTRRELYRLEGGALLLDTPGIRELRLWDVDAGLERAFPDVEELALGCRFRDCRHDTEPECAVRAAEASGQLPAERLASYRKLRAEVDHQERQGDPLARKAAVAAHKTALKTLRYHPKYGGDV